MSNFEWAGAVLSLAVFGLTGLGLLWYALTGRGKTAGAFNRNRDGSFHAVCAVCAAAAEVRADALVRLSSAEKALVVRENPSALGKDLLEYICPHCDASHCFSADRGSVELIGVNLYEGQQFQVLCKECRKTLESPPWPAGTYDGRLREAPGDISSLGVVCPFCGATSCVGCCTSITRNRTGDGSLLCPRCYRGPVERFFHPTAEHVARN